MIVGDSGAGAERSEGDEGARRREPLIGNAYVAPGLQQSYNSSSHPFLLPMEDKVLYNSVVLIS